MVCPQNKPKKKKTHKKNVKNISKRQFQSSCDNVHKTCACSSLKQFWNGKGRTGGEHTFPSQVRSFWQKPHGQAHHSQSHRDWFNSSVNHLSVPIYVLGSFLTAVTKYSKAAQQRQGSLCSQVWAILHQGGEVNMEGIWHSLTHHIDNYKKKERMNVSTCQGLSSLFSPGSSP